MSTGLGLDTAGVAFDAARGVVVDETLRTSRPNIFAVGDVTGDYPLVHVAIYQGEIAARNAVSGEHEEADYRIVSAHTIFTDPQIAHVGMTEKELKAAGIDALRRAATTSPSTARRCVSIRRAVS